MIIANKGSPDFLNSICKDITSAPITDQLVCHIIPLAVVFVHICNDY